jgi:hypothetical protein
MVVTDIVMLSLSGLILLFLVVILFYLQEIHSDAKAFWRGARDEYLQTMAAHKVVLAEHAELLAGLREVQHQVGFWPAEDLPAPRRGQ